MNRSLLRVLALVLPLLGLAAAWIVTHHRAQQGVEWEVPVKGYDPRDLLRGHYIQYQYDWPGLERNENEPINWGHPNQICLEGNAPRLVRVVQPSFKERCASLAVALEATEFEWGMINSWTGRLYVPQTQATAMEAKLRDPKLQAFVRIRLRPDGHITPLAMTFRPRAAVP